MTNPLSHHHTAKENPLQSSSSQRVMKLTAPSGLPASALKGKRDYPAFSGIANLCFAQVLSERKAIQERNRLKRRFLS